MRIAVTGASGFIGGVIARTLAAAGHTVHTFGRRSLDQLTRPLPSYTQWNVLSELRRKSSVDVVVHCAAKLGDWGAEEEYFHVNVEGTQNVLDTFADARQFIYVSSASVYSGKQPERILSEDASVGVELYSAYSRSKAAAERALLAGRRDVIILRPHIVYGPGDTTLMPRLLAARKLGCLVVPGDGRNPVSITHIHNFVHAVQCVFESDLTAGTFNIADTETPNISDLLRTLLAIHGTPTRLLFIPRSMAWGAAVASENLFRFLRTENAPRLTRYLVAQTTSGHTLDLSRAYSLLGYRPKYGFRQSLSNRDSE